MLRLFDSCFKIVTMLFLLGLMLEIWYDPHFSRMNVETLYFCDVGDSGTILCEYIHITSCSIFVQVFRSRTPHYTPCRKFRSVYCSKVSAALTLSMHCTVFLGLGTIFVLPCFLINSRIRAARRDGSALLVTISSTFFQKFSGAFG